MVYTQVKNSVKIVALGCISVSVYGMDVIKNSLDQAMRNRAEALRNVRASGTTAANFTVIYNEQGDPIDVVYNAELSAENNTIELYFDSKKNEIKHSYETSNDRMFRWFSYTMIGLLPVFAGIVTSYAILDIKARYK